jgi:formylglycine-generating enzyme required for sulfatase activity
MAKIALLIGVSEYPSGDLKPLRNAINDAKAMQRILNHPEMGAFDEVKLLENPEKRAMEKELEVLFSGQRYTQDLLLFYFSGHGTRDDIWEGKLYFATHDTETEYLRATAVASNFVHDLMDTCRSKRQVVILDCCFSAAFTEGLTAKDAGTINIQQQLGGEGRAILASSTSTQYSYEQETDELSIYTHYLIEGIETGKADQNQDGKLSVDELHQYAKEKVQENKPPMKPEIFAIGEGYNIFLARNPKIFHQDEEKPKKDEPIDIIESLRKRTLNQNEIDALKEMLGMGQNLNGSVPSPSGRGLGRGPGEVFRDELKDGGLGPEMVIVPAGIFKMGDIQNTGYDDEKPVHEVSVKSFAIGRYQVTVAEFQQFVEATHYKTEAETGDGAYIWKKLKWQLIKDAYWRNPYFPQRDNQPVVCISWNDAMAYINWLCEQTGNTYRLPSEAEWEYAARAGTKTDYWWGNKIGKNKANCYNSGSQWSGKQTSPVGSFDPNPYGLYDTVGNVWEWCADSWHDNYEGAPTDDSVWEGDSSLRVVRGGAWNNAPWSVRVSYRDRWRHDDRGYNGGVRPAKL